MSKDKEPKVIPVFYGSYNYIKLKKEGLVDNEEKEDKKEYTPENDPFGGY